MALTPKQLQILDAILFLIRKGELPTVREIGALVGLRSSATVAKHLKALVAEKLITISGKSRGIRIADPELLQSLLDGREPTIWKGSSEPDELGNVARAAGSPTTERAASEEEGTDERSRSRRGGETPELPAVRAGGERPPGSGRSSSTGTILQAHFPKISSHGVGLPILGRIAAGHPIESWEEAYRDVDPLGSQPSLAIDPRMFAGSGELVALKVEGDSMVEAGILDGDYVIIRRQAHVEDGEIAAVLVNGEGTLKRLYHVQRATPAEDEAAAIDALFEDGDDEPGHPNDLARSAAFHTLAGGRAAAGSHGRTETPETVRLNPANDRFEPIVISESDRKEVIVFGKYVGLVRGDLRIL